MKSRRHIATYCDPQLIMSKEMKVSVDIELDPHHPPSDHVDPIQKKRAKSEESDISQCKSITLDPNKTKKNRKRVNTAEDRERKRKRMAVMIGVVAAAIFVLAFLMVAIGLRMNAYIDDMLRKENENMVQTLSSIPNGETNSTTAASLPSDTGDLRFNSSASQTLSTVT